MAKKTEEEFLQDYMDRAVEFGADPVDAGAEARRMADRALRLGHIEPGGEPISSGVAAMDRSGSSAMWNERYDPGPVVIIETDLEENFAPPVAMTDQDRFDRTRRGLPMESLSQAVLGAAPVPTVAALGLTADINSPRSARMAMDAADVSDIENARLDSQYYREMGKAGQGTKQTRAATQLIDDLPEVYGELPADRQWGGKYSIDEAPQMDAHREARKAYRERGPMGSASAREKSKQAWRGATEARWLGPGAMDDALDAAFEGSAKAGKAKARMEQLRDIGKVAMKSAYVGPWLTMAEGVGAAMAIPMMAADNYMKIDEPYEQIRYFALQGVRRPLKAGDMSPEGLAWLSSHMDLTDQMNRDGLISDELLMKLNRPGGEDAALADAQSAYDQAESWTPTKDQIRALSGR
jgi:hypothetical protein